MDIKQEFKDESSESNNQRLIFHQNSLPANTDPQIKKEPDLDIPFEDGSSDGRDDTLVGGSRDFSDESKITQKSSPKRTSEKVNHKMGPKKIKANETMLSPTGIDAEKKNIFKEVLQSLKIACVIVNKVAWYERNFVCKFCYHIYPDSEDLTKHVLTKECTSYKRKYSDTFVCDVCAYTTVISSNIKRHRLLHTGEKPFACHVCPYRCRDSFSLGKHLKRHSAARRTPKVVRPPRDPSPENRNGNKALTCDRCSYECRKRNNMRTHKMLHGKDDQLSCGVCSFTCSSLNSFEDHKLIHLVSDDLLMNILDSSRALLIESVAKYDDKTFKSAYESFLKENSDDIDDSVTQESVHAYPIAHVQCEYDVTQTNDSIEDHSKTVDSSLDGIEVTCFTCDECGYRTPQKSNMTRHRRKHSGKVSAAPKKKTLVCPDCQYTCTHRGYFNQHMLIHTNEKMLYCDRCPYTSRFNSNMKRHKTRHADGNVLPCADEASLDTSC